MTVTTLYVWPKVGEVPSLDPSCLAVNFYLQLRLRGRYTLSYCGSPDESPSGQLPCLSHGQHNVSGLLSIFKFVDQLQDASPYDSSPSAVERAQSVARVAQIEADLGDFVAYAYFAVSANWYGQTRPALTSTLAIPQRYYVPGRLRKSYQPRLEAASLWLTHGEEGQNDRFSAFEKLARKKDTKEKKEKLKQALEKEKVLSKARTFLDSYSSILGSRRFFYSNGNSPSPLDIVFASHICLLLQPLPDNAITTLLKESYPALVSHSETIYSLAFPDADSQPPLTTPLSIGHSLRLLLPTLPFTATAYPQRSVDAAEEAKFARWRYAFYGTAVFVTATYVYASGIVPLVIGVLAEQQRLRQEEVRLEREEEEEDD